MPDEVLGADRATQDRWIFQHAATWPDVARGGPYDQPWWHFVNHPYYLGESDKQLADRLPFNQSYEYPASGELDRLNVVQAIKHAQATIADESAARRATPSQPLERMELPADYLKEAGERARQRVVQAGMRLGSLLN